LVVVPVADQFEATIEWGADEPLLPGRAYVLPTPSASVVATVAPLKYALAPGTTQRVPATKLDRGAVGVCQLELDEAIFYEPYSANAENGGFVLLDRDGGEVLGSGRIHFALRRSENVHWQSLDVDKASRAGTKGQRPCVVWLTGLPGAGKSTVANLLERRLHADGYHTYLLDGDNVRHGLTKDLGFTPADRVENIRRVGEVARLMVDAGLIVIASFISPYRSERRTVRSLVEPGEFFEVFVDAPLEVAEARDPKGLYRKARRGELVNFTGVDAPYEAPEAPELHLETDRLTPEESVDRLVDALVTAGVLARETAALPPA
jgi:bifunctional enzyme CysN/CysC